MNPEQAMAYATQAHGVLDGLGGPLGLVGRICGLGQDELESGIPGWAWFGMGVVAGGAAVYLMRDRIEKVVG
jgi:hypothetical protein